MKLLLILSGVLLGGGLWIGCILRRQWRAPFADVLPLSKLLDNRKRSWNGDCWK